MGGSEVSSLEAGRQQRTQDRQEQDWRPAQVMPTGGKPGKATKGKPTPRKAVHCEMRWHRGEAASDPGLLLGLCLTEHGQVCSRFQPDGGKVEIRIVGRREMRGLEAAMGIKPHGLKLWLANGGSWVKDRIGEAG